MILHAEGNEMIIVHNSAVQAGKAAMKYAKQEGFVVKEYDIKDNSLTSTQWLQIAESIGGVKGLINLDHDLFEEKYKSVKDLSDLDWVRLLEHHPEMLDTPIAITKDKVKKVYAPAEVAHM